MVTARQRLTSQENKEAIDKEDISFTPMAVPMVSGPGAIGVVIGLSTRASQWVDYLGCLIGIALLGILLYLCLALGKPLIEKLGSTVIGALNRILGFLILAIAVQLIAAASFQENSLVVDWVKSQALAPVLTCIGDGHNGIWNIVRDFAPQHQCREISKST